MREHERQSQLINGTSTRAGEVAERAPQVFVLWARVRLGEPPVRECLLDDDAEPSFVSRVEQSRERWFEAVECRLNGVEHALPIDTRGDRRLERTRRRRPAERESDGPIRADAAALDQRAHQPGVRDRLRRGTVDLVECEPTAEECAALGELRREARDRELLLLVDGRVDPPARGVAIAPLAADREVHRSPGEPARQKLLRPPVASRDVDIPDIRRAGGVQQLGAALVERLRRPRPGQVVDAPQVDVAGTPDGGEAEPEA